MNSSTDHLVIPYRRYLADSIGSLFTSNRRTIRAINCSINSSMFSKTILEGPSWENYLVQVCRVCTTASYMKNISTSIIFRLTMPPCSIIFSKSKFSLTQIFSSMLRSKWEVHWATFCYLHCSRRRHLYIFSIGACNLLWRSSCFRLGIKYNLPLTI